MKRLLVVLMGLGLVLGLSMSYAAELSTAYVDFEKTFNEYHKTKTEDARLKSELEKKEKELDGKAAEISKMSDELELLSDEAREKKQKEIRERIKELNQLRKDARQDLLDKRNKIWLEIYDEIKEVVAQYSKKKGYTFVFDDKALIYKADGYDITDEIVKMLNKGK